MIKRLTSHFMSFYNSELSVFRASSVIAVCNMQDAIVKTELMSPPQVRPFSPFSQFCHPVILAGSPPLCEFQAITSNVQHQPVVVPKVVCKNCLVQIIPVQQVVRVQIILMPVLVMRPLRNSASWDHSILSQPLTRSAGNKYKQRMPTISKRLSVSFD